MAGSALQMETQPEVERESDMGRPSFSEQGPHFIFQSSFYTLSYAQRTMGEGVESYSKSGFLPANLSYAKVYVIHIIFWPRGLLTF